MIGQGASRKERGEGGDNAVVAHEEIAQCVQQCLQAANQLRSAANQINDNRAREMATSAAVHVEMCIHQCEDAMRSAQVAGRL